MVNDKLFSLHPINELISIVKNDLRKYDDEGLIDAGTLTKAVMYCNEKLGIPIREIRQVCLPVEDFKAPLPVDFEKLYYVCALRATNTSVQHMRNPFDNHFDSDIITEVDIDRGSFGNATSVSVVIKRDTKQVVHHHSQWIPLTLSSSTHAHISCPNLRKPGRYQIEICDDHIVTPFKSGQLYMMYIGAMKDEFGNVTFPFHPMITPYYEWVLKEKVLADALLNSDGGFEETKAKLQFVQGERAKAYIDAWNITLERGYGEWVQAERKKELSWYNKYFKLFQ